MMRDGWYVVERYDNKERSVFQVTIQKWNAGPHEHVEVTILGVGDDHSFTSIEEFTREYLLVRRLDLSAVELGEIL